MARNRLVTRGMIRPLLGVVALQLLLLPQAHAGPCDSATKVAVDLWDAYGKHAKQAGCRSAATAAVVASSGAAGNPETTYEQCLDNVNQREQMARQMIATWNRLANNNWATLGLEAL